MKGGVTIRVWAKVIKTDITTFSSINIAHAVFGFRQMGAEIVEYENLDQIYDQVTKDDLVLEPYLGRKIWKDTINRISADRSTWGTSSSQ